MTVLRLRGFDIRKQYLNTQAQNEVLQAVRAVAETAPVFSPMTPYGKPMTVRMTSAGKYGWFPDASGYRYVRTHPSGTPWPDIPPKILDIWRAVSGVDRMPDCCLVNFYGEGARMGLHQDKDEADFRWPVVSVSLGDDGLFRIGTKPGAAKRNRSGCNRGTWWSWAAPRD